MIYNRSIKIWVAFYCLALAGCQSESLKDIDGNRYRTVTIGSQVWMAENLKTTKYSDGTDIPLVTLYDSWAELNTAAYCWYNNDPANKDIYGALYNWHVVKTNKLCPKGWHVPTKQDWVTLGNYLTGPKNAGGKLKEKGTTHWRKPNQGATNESGFTALPGGYRSYNGSFNFTRVAGYWWSSTEDYSGNIFFANLRYNSNSFYYSISSNANGFCVRCLQD